MFYVLVLLALLGVTGRVFASRRAERSKVEPSRPVRAGQMTPAARAVSRSSWMLGGHG